MQPRYRRCRTDANITVWFDANTVSFTSASLASAKSDAGAGAGALLGISNDIKRVGRPFDTEVVICVAAVVVG